MLRILGRACGIVSFARTQKIPRLNFFPLWDTLTSPSFSSIAVLCLSLTLILFLHKVGKHYHHSIKYKGKWMARRGGGRSYGVIIVVLFLVPRPQPPMSCVASIHLSIKFFIHILPPPSSPAHNCFFLSIIGALYILSPQYRLEAQEEGKGAGEAWGNETQAKPIKTGEEKPNGEKQHRICIILSSSNAGKAANYISFSF